MKTKQTTGRPIASRNIRVIPEFREKPDVEKLGRALIAIAKMMTGKETAEESTPPVSGKGNGMP